MKTFLLLIFFVITLATQAQTSVYHPFPDSDAVWNQEYIGDDFPTCKSIAKFSYVMQGDAIINGVNYHKINVPYVNLVYNNPNCINWMGAGCCIFLRQDTSGRKVFVYNNTTDDTLYDFTLKIGDTLHSKFYPNYLVLDVIDSILIDGSYRTLQRFKPTFPAPQIFEVIEGIGSRQGLLELGGWCLDGCGYQLDCFQQNGKTLYPNSTNSCNIISSVNNLSEKDLVVVSPNPAKAHLTIKTNINTPAEIIIYDIASRKLIEEKFIKEVSLNIAVLAKGIYLYQVIDEKGTITRGKVVKE